MEDLITCKNWNIKNVVDKINQKRNKENEDAILTNTRATVNEE